MFATKVKRDDESFLKSVLGRMRLMNQLRGNVTLCSRPSKASQLRAMMNSPESLSARLHKVFGSVRSLLWRTSLSV